MDNSEAFNEARQLRESLKPEVWQMMKNFVLLNIPDEQLFRMAADRLLTKHSSEDHHIRMDLWRMAEKHKR